MLSGLRFVSLVLAVSLMVACSDDESICRPSTAKSDSKQSSNPKPDAASAEVPDSGTRLRGESQSSDVLKGTGFAGFGRVGRSLYSDVDYRARWAVIVGVNRFKDEGLSKLDNAVNDARAVRDMLRDEFGYDHERIIFLTDQDRNAAGVPTDKEPITKDRLLQAFEDLASRDIRSSDAILFFFAGHGKSDGKGTFLAAHDSNNDDLSTWVDVGALKKKLASLNARHKLMILDSCYAGSLLQVDLSKEIPSNSPVTQTTPNEPVSTKSASVAGEPARTRGNEKMELRDQLVYYMQEPAFLAITSGRDQPVGDASFAQPEHSPFTTAFLQILEERANSARAGDVFTARELAVRVESQVRAGQTPDWGRLGAGRGDFIFTPTRDRLTPREIAERDDYFIYINLAQAAIEKEQWTKAVIALDRCGKEHRHFEWYHLRTSVNDCDIVWRGHEGDVRTVVVSADGKHLLSGGLDGTIKFWDVTKPGAPIATWMAHPGGVTALAISKDNTIIASGGFDNTLKIWNLRNPRDILNQTAPTSMPVTAIAISNDGMDIACAIGIVGKPGEILLRTQGENDLQPRWDGGKTKFPVTSLAFSPDGKQIVSGSAGSVTNKGELTVWDRKTFQPILNKLERVAKGATVGGVAWSSDGSRIAASNGDGTLSVWDANRGGAPLITIKAHPYDVGAIALSSDGKRVFTSRTLETVVKLIKVDPQELVHSIKMWDVESGQLLSKLDQHDAVITSLALSPDGRHIYSGSFDGTVRKWPTASFAKTRTLAGHDEGVVAISLSPDGRRIASGSGRQAGPAWLKVWDADSGQLLWTSPAQKKGINSIAFSRDGKHIATGSGDAFSGRGELALWDAEQGDQPLWAFPTSDMESVTAVAFSPTDATLAAVTSRFHTDGVKVDFNKKRGTFHLWKYEDSQVPFKQIENHHEEIVALAFSADGRHVVFNGSDGQRDAIEIIDAKTGQPTRSLPMADESISSLAFSRNGQHLVTVTSETSKFRSSTSTSLKIWDWPHPQHPRQTFNAVGTSVALTTDGKRLITGSAGKEGVQVWDAQRGGEALLTLGNARGPVAVSPAGKRIVSAGDEGKTIVIWNTKHWPK